VKLTIDGALVSAQLSKSGDVTTVNYQPAAFFASGSQHTAIISFTAGGVPRTESWQFTVAAYALLTKAHQAVSVDKSKPGFIWSMFQNEAVTPTSVASTEEALAGLLKAGDGSALPNLADSAVRGPALADGVKVGPLFRFEIPTVINLSQTEATALGNFTPDEQMPGIPGTTGSTDGIDAAAITFVELPVGTITMGVNSDDGFRSQAGYINVPADGLFLGEFDAGRGATDTIFRFVVQDAGIYPIRTIWQEGGGDANIEIFTVKADGTKVLINDTANGGFKSYRTGVAPNKPISFSLAVQTTGGEISITWTEPGAVLQQSTDLKTWADVPNATSPHRPTVAGTPASFYRLKK